MTYAKDYIADPLLQLAVLLGGMPVARKIYIPVLLWDLSLLFREAIASAFSLSAVFAWDNHTHTHTLCWG